MKVAVLGATGAVGRTMLQVLEERDVAVDELVPLASARSVGTTVRFRGRDWPVTEPTASSFTGCTLALFSAGAARSRTWAETAVQAGVIVIDNSSAWRADDAVPLVVPEVNAAAAAYRPKGIIANPNCATIQLVVALEALRRVVSLKSVIATTFQSVSGAGQAGIDALHAEQRGDVIESPFVAPIAGNVIPWIGPRGADGWNEEETKVRSETRRILALPQLPVTATCVRVPVEVGHAIAAAVHLSRPLDRTRARAALAAMPSLAVCDDGRDPVPLDVAGSDGVCVGHLRVDPDVPNVLHLWIVADNLRKGAATNAVQIAETVIDA